MKQITCDTCHRPVTPNVKTQRTSGGGELWHFACPHCGHRYDVCRITRHGINLRHQLESTKAQLRLAPHAEDLIEKRDALLAALQNEITDLTTPRFLESSPSSASSPAATETTAP